MIAFQIEGNLYKIKLENRYGPLFEDNFSSGDWDPFIKALYNDYNKNEEFVFHHPIHKHIQFYRRYIYSPANGEAQLVIGQLRDKMDCANIRIVLHSIYYEEPYIAVYDYERSFETADIAMDMLVYSFNQTLKNTPVVMTYTPWLNHEAKWLLDSETAYKYQFHITEGKFCPIHGLEDLYEKQNKPETKKEPKKSLPEKAPQQLTINFFVVDKADISVNCPGNTIAGTINNINNE